MSDQPVLARLLGQHLARTRRFRLSGAAQDAASALQLARELHPEIIVIDCALLDPTDAAALARWRQIEPKANVILFDAPVESKAIRTALQSGVRGYLAVDTQLNELVDALVKVSRNARYFSHSVTDFIEDDYCRLLTELAQRNPNRTSGREQQVMDEVAHGRRTKEIANQLSLSTRTVEAHRRNYARKRES